VGPIPEKKKQPVASGSRPNQRKRTKRRHPVVGKTKALEQRVKSSEEWPGRPQKRKKRRFNHQKDQVKKKNGQKRVTPGNGCEKKGKLHPQKKGVLFLTNLSTGQNQPMEPTSLRGPQRSGDSPLEAKRGKNTPPIRKGERKHVKRHFRPKKKTQRRGGTFGAPSGKQNYV